MALGPQFSEHLALRKELGGLIAENRRLYPPPAGMDGGSQGRPGMMAANETLDDKNNALREKIASTKVSNAIGRGEAEPTADRFG